MGDQAIAGLGVLNSKRIVHEIDKLIELIKAMGSGFGFIDFIN